MIRSTLLASLTLLAGCPLIFPCGDGPPTTCEQSEAAEDPSGIYTDGELCLDDSDTCLTVIEARIDGSEVELLLEEDDGLQSIVRWSRDDFL